MYPMLLKYVYFPSCASRYHICSFSHLTGIFVQAADVTYNIQSALSTSATNTSQILQLESKK